MTAATIGRERSWAELLRLVRCLQNLEKAAQEVAPLGDDVLLSLIDQAVSRSNQLADLIVGPSVRFYAAWERVEQANNLTPLREPPCPR